MVLVVRVRWASRCKDAGSPDSGDYRGDRGRGSAASSAAAWHSHYFAKPPIYGVRVGASVSRAIGSSAAASSAGTTRVASTSRPPASEATSAPTPHQTPDRLPSQPSARSIEKRPGPVAATESAAAQMTRLYSNPPFVIQNPFRMCTDPTATTITDAIAAATNGVRNPSANATPL